jgi:hypothetical protein
MSESDQPRPIRREVAPGLPPRPDPNEPSRTIPRPVAREVRQRCGFGCVICGFPLFEYEHMEEWAVVKRHVASEMTLLCDRHHREKTSKLLPIEAVRAANADPYNLRTGVTTAYPLHFSGDSCEAAIGSNSFVLRAVEVEEPGSRFLLPIVVDNDALLAFRLEDDRLLLSLHIFDEFNFLALRILDNQLQYSVQPWDVEFVGTTLTLRTAQRRVLLEIRFAPPNRVVIERGRFLRNGVELTIQPDYVRLENEGGTIAGTNFTGRHSAAGIAIGALPGGVAAALRFEYVNRYPKRDKSRGGAEAM